MQSLQFKRIQTASVAPTSSQLLEGELVMNVADGRIYTKDHNGNVKELGSLTSVNNKRGAVTLSAGDVGAYTKAEVDGLLNTFGVEISVQPVQLGVSGQTQYNLATTYAITPKDLRVSVDGILQRPDTDYTTGTIGKIDFVGSVPTNAVIDIICYKKNPTT